MVFYFDLPTLSQQVNSHNHNETDKVPQTLKEFDALITEGITPLQTAVISGNSSKAYQIISNLAADNDSDSQLLTDLLWQPIIFALRADNLTMLDTLFKAVYEYVKNDKSCPLIKTEEFLHTYLRNQREAIKLLLNYHWLIDIKPILERAVSINDTELLHHFCVTNVTEPEPEVIRIIYPYYFNPSNSNLTNWSEFLFKFMLNDIIKGDDTIIQTLNNHFGQNNHEALPPSELNSTADPYFEAIKQALNPMPKRNEDIISRLVGHSIVTNNVQLFHVIFDVVKQTAFVRANPDLDYFSKVTSLLDEKQLAYDRKALPMDYLSLNPLYQALLNLQRMEKAQKTEFITADICKTIINHNKPGALVYLVSTLNDYGLYNEYNLQQVAHCEHPLYLQQWLYFLHRAGLNTQQNFEDLLDPHNYWLVAEACFVWQQLDTQLMTQSILDNLLIYARKPDAEALTRQYIDDLVQSNRRQNEPLWTPAASNVHINNLHFWSQRNVANPQNERFCCNELRFMR